MPFRDRQSKQVAVIRLAAALSLILAVSLASCKIQHMEESATVSAQDLRGAAKFQAIKEVGSGI